ncbi:hypothetical protein IV38_GL001971 [Lactobacillus selangorensis]|uniref:Phage holin, LL-H family n=1 Tax=Lactobacillus selangorensis TaxID=81857 RepID=A0A0R2FXI5_9LACO|nr:phage holin [Lactobacillus selangorensis]KRN27756.1 hypothetical protein IV38_GL001971 [Lactobacillus selangorensis]KRN30279.1 hypothetical protein IV40_GL001866 [Lactobacillus selangorensis]
MQKWISDFISGGGLVFTLGLLVYIYTTGIRPWLEARIKTEKDAKTVASYKLIEQWADTAVYAAQRQGGTGLEKKTIAVQAVRQQADDHKITVDAQHVSAVVEKAYAQNAPVLDAVYSDNSTPEEVNAAPGPASQQADDGAILPQQTQGEAVQNG